MLRGDLWRRLDKALSGSILLGVAALLISDQPADSEARPPLVIEAGCRVPSANGAVYLMALGVESPTVCDGRAFVHPPELFLPKQCSHLLGDANGPLVVVYADAQGVPATRTYCQALFR